MNGVCAQQWTGDQWPSVKRRCEGATLSQFNLYKGTLCTVAIYISILVFASCATCHLSVFLQLSSEKMRLKKPRKVHKICIVYCFVTLTLQQIWPALWPMTCTYTDIYVSVSTVLSFSVLLAELALWFTKQLIWRENNAYGTKAPCCFTFISGSGLRSLLSSAKIYVLDNSGNQRQGKCVSESMGGKGVSGGWLQSHFPRLCRALLAEEFYFKDNLSTAEHFGKEQPCGKGSVFVCACVRGYNKKIF